MIWWRKKKKDENLEKIEEGIENLESEEVSELQPELGEIEDNKNTEVLEDENIKEEIKLEGTIEKDCEESNSLEGGHPENNGLEETDLHNEGKYSKNDGEDIDSVSEVRGLDDELVESEASNSADINGDGSDKSEILESGEVNDDESIKSDALDRENDGIDDSEFAEGDLNDSEEDHSESTEVEKSEGGFFSRLLSGLSKTKKNITDRIDSLLGSYKKIDEDLLEELEEILITADVGVNTTMEIIDRLREKAKRENIEDASHVKGMLKEIVEDILSEGNSKIVSEPPTIIVMVGVNGVGKTTTIGKLARRFKSEKKKVMLAAADTFRAAATEQLDIWAKRAGVDIVKHHEGADPGAVVFDAIKASKARGVDVLICDTAGRLHNKQNLMNELGKIFKIIDREYPEANKEVLLVVDATTGQNAVSQAKTFKEVANITGIVLTKLDGTAKGGVVIAVKSEVGVPVKLIGVGEKVEDLQDFDPKAFSDALFE